MQSPNMTLRMPKHKFLSLNILLLYIVMFKIITSFYLQAKKKREEEEKKIINRIHAIFGIILLFIKIWSRD